MENFFTIKLEMLGLENLMMKENYYWPMWFPFGDFSCVPVNAPYLVSPPYILFLYQLRFPAIWSYWLPILYAQMSFLALLKNA